MKGAVYRRFCAVPSRNTAQTIPCYLNSIIYSVLFLIIKYKIIFCLFIHQTVNNIGRLRNLSVVAVLLRILCTIEAHLEFVARLLSLLTVKTGFLKTVTVL